MKFLFKDLIIASYAIFSEYSTHDKIDDNKDSIAYKIEDNNCNKSENEIEMILIIDIQPNFLKWWVKKTCDL